MQDKKTLIIVIVVLVLALGLVTYWFLQRQSTEGPGSMVDDSPMGGLESEQPLESSQSSSNQQLLEESTGTQQPNPF